MKKNQDKGLIGNEKIEEGIQLLKESFTEENLAVVLTTIRKRITENGQFVVAVDATGTGNHFSLKTASYQGKKWFVAFTCFEEEMKGSQNIVSGFLADIGQLCRMAQKSDEVEGVILNPFGNMMTLNTAILDVVLNR